MAPRIAIFTHDTFGLGHVRRCLHFARALAAQVPEAPILFITGSPALHVFDLLPPHVDFVKIPTIAKTGPEHLRPPHLPLPLDEVTALRSRIIQEAVLRFAPDVFLVDNFPLGSRNELRDTLEALSRTSTQCVLGLRDILDAPEVVRTEWTRQGTYEVLDRFYDRILVYGMRDVLDVPEAYGFPTTVAEKTHYCGYVTAAPTASRSAAEIREELGVSSPFLLATAGGGGDGFPLLKTFLDALPFIPETPAVVVTGPLMSVTERNQLKVSARERRSVRLHDYVADLRGFLGAADVVVSMCGYNTAAEIVAEGARAVMVPRTWRYGEHLKGPSAGVEWEQLLRARSLAKLGLVDFLEPESVTPEHLADSIKSALAHETRARKPVDLHGVRNVTRHLLEMAGKNGGAAHDA
jgi:predicted glycosyltransferase